MIRSWNDNGIVPVKLLSSIKSNKTNNNNKEVRKEKKKHLYLTKKQMIKTQFLTRKNLPKLREVRAVNDPSSVGIGPDNPLMPDHSNKINK